MMRLVLTLPPIFSNNGSPGNHLKDAIEAMRMIKLRQDGCLTGVDA
jgi:hypothetical protein